MADATTSGELEELVPVQVPRSRLTEVYTLLGQPPGQPGITTDEAEPDPDEWQVEHFSVLLGDSRPSVRRVALILDELAKRPDTAVSMTELVQATGLTRGKLKGALSGFTRVCKMLWPDSAVGTKWPMRFSWGQAQEPGQDGEAYYTLRRSYAERWQQARRAQR